MQIDGRPIGRGRARGRPRPRAGGGARRRARARRGADAVRGADRGGVPRCWPRPASRPASSRRAWAGATTPPRVVDARVVGLTNVGLDHQRVLGDTREEILAEKLAVLGRGAALCVGVVDDALYAQRGASWPRPPARAASASAPGAGEGLPLPGRLPARRRRARAPPGRAVARAARARSRARDGRARRGRSAGPARARSRGSRRSCSTARTTPRACGRSCGELDGELGKRRPRVGVLALQDDKPVAEMLAALAPALDARRRDDQRTRGPCARAARRGARRRGARGGLRRRRRRAEPFIALARARERAGAGGAVVVTGSLYLLERLRAAALEAR